METVLLICGAIITISGAITAVAKYIVKPLNELVKLKDDVEELKQGQRVMGKALIQVLQHQCYGDHIDDLKKEYENLKDFYINQ